MESPIASTGQPLGLASQAASSTTPDSQSIPTWAPWLAWSLWALTMALSATALGLLFASRSAPVPPAFFFRGAYVLMALAFGTVGALVASRRRENPIGWLLCAFGVLVAIPGLGLEYAAYALIAHPDMPPGGEIVAWVANWTPVLAAWLVITTLLIFPNGKLPSPRWRYFLWFSVLVYAANMLWYALVPGPLDLFASVENPFGVGLLDPLKRVGRIAFPLLWPTVTVGLAVSLVLRYRNAGDDARWQIKWLAYSAALVAGTTAVSGLVAAMRGTQAASVASLLSGLAILTVPVAMGIAILRYRLYDIDLVINRTLVYGSLTAIVAGVYVAIAGFFQRLFVSLTGEWSEGAIIAATTVVAFSIFTPVKNRLQALVDKRFKQGGDPGARLRMFQEQVRAVVQVMDAERMLARLLDEAVSAFGAESGMVYVQHGQGLRKAHVLGDWRGEASLSVPLRYKDQQTGQLFLGLRKDARPYSTQDERALQELADLVAEAVALTEAQRDMLSASPSP